MRGKVAFIDRRGSCRLMQVSEISLTKAMTLAGVTH